MRRPTSMSKSPIKGSTIGSQIRKAVADAVNANWRFVRVGIHFSDEPNGGKVRDSDLRRLFTNGCCRRKPTLGPEISNRRLQTTAERDTSDLNLNSANDRVEPEAANAFLSLKCLCCVSEF